MFFVFERVHLHYYAIILSYCNYIISEINCLKMTIISFISIILVQYIAQQKVVIATAYTHTEREGERDHPGFHSV